LLIYSVGEKLKNRLENLERLAEQIAPRKPVSSPLPNDLANQIDAEEHPSSAEEDSENFHSAFQRSNALDDQDVNLMSDSIFFNLAPETEFTSSYDDNFWILGDSEYAVPELAEIPDPLLDVPSSETQVDNFQGCLTSDYQQQESTNQYSPNAASFQGGFVFDSSATSELNESQDTLEVSSQHSPCTTITTSTVSTSSLQLYKNTSKPKTPIISYVNKKRLSQETIQQLRLDDTKENQCLVSKAIARGYNIRDVFLSGLQALGNNSKLPSVHRNTLTLVRTSTLQAYLTVATAAGIHIPDLYLDFTPSPFYRPNATPTTISTLLSHSFSSLPPDLRPTAAQIFYPHKPWLDLLPFPTLRERALTLTSTTPPIIDLQELKNDIFFNNGLFCWQASATKGGGHPWDRRSWEAEEWFLKKWWILIGGEEADVVFQTRWWREMRGEGKLELGWGK
jgi:hypothetical protein